MDPTSLPEEVAEQIFILLPLKDILSCCLVSSSWRDAVNKNIIWRKHCSPEINLEDVESVVKPSFQVPQSDCEKLTPICDYRLKYMQEIHLRNNFRNNRCVEYQLSFSIAVYGFAFVNKYLIINDFNTNMFHVWNIEGNPDLIQSMPHLLKQTHPKTFKSLGDCLLIVQYTLLQIYEIVEGKLSLKMCRVLDMEEAFSHTIPAADNLSEWYFSHFERNPEVALLDDLIVGKYFIGTVVHPFSQSVMHIWDLETGKKLKEDVIPENLFEVKNISSGNKSLLISLIDPNSNGVVKPKLFSYNLEELKFTELKLNSKSTYLPLIGYEKFVIVFSYRTNTSTLVFLDSNTGEKNFQMSVDCHIDPSVYDVYNSLMACSCYNKTVTVVDLSTRETLLIRAVNFEVCTVYFLDFNILLVGGFDYCCEVWDIKNNCHLYTLYKHILFSERGLTRIGVLNKVNNSNNQWSCSIIKYW